MPVHPVASRRPSRRRPIRLVLARCGFLLSCLLLGLHPAAAQEDASQDAPSLAEQYCEEAGRILGAAVSAEMPERRVPAGWRPPESEHPVTP